MKISNEDKVSMVNEQHGLMLESASTDIKDSGVILSESIAEILERIDQNSKEYATLLQVKELILSLTEEISQATSAEEILNIRKVVNYHINKMKKVLVARNVSEDTINAMYAKTEGLRGNMSKYLRYLKRENNISEINRLYAERESLSKEDALKLKKLLANEVRYGKRILTKKDETPIAEPSVAASVFDINQGAIEVDLEVIDEKVDKEDRQVLALVENVDQSLLFSASEEESGELVFPREIKGILSAADGKSLEEFTGSYETKIASQAGRYDLEPLHQYGRSILSNISSFIRNLPKYSANNKRLRTAIRDYNIYYHGPDLGGFIKYSQMRNSIATGLSCVFKKSHLNDKAYAYLNDCEKIAAWVEEFYPSRDFQYEASATKSL